MKCKKSLSFILLVAIFTSMLASTGVYAGADNISPTDVWTGGSGIKAIAAGRNHILALREDGTIVAWGANGSGQCDILQGLSGVKAIAAGDLYSVALKMDGTVVAWGDNLYGQCDVPQDLYGVKAIAASKYHTVALKEDGTVAAWGQNSSRQCNVPSRLSEVKAIAAGYNHSLAVKGDGTVVAWGDNYKKQCTVPQDLTGVKAVAAGYRFSVALKEDGTAVAWGTNDNEQCAVPQGLSEIKSIVAGYDHVIALREDGVIIAWGGDKYKQCTIPQEVFAVKAVSAGWNYSVALIEDGPVVGWGNTKFTIPFAATVTLKDTNNSTDTRDSKVTEDNKNTEDLNDFATSGTSEKEAGNESSAGENKVKCVSTGQSHSLVVKEDGSLWAWGQNGYGQLGDGSLIQKKYPVKIMDGIMSTDAGTSHSLALKEDGSLWAWGQNQIGQLGDGTFGDQNVPVKIMDEVRIPIAGEFSSYAIKDDGSLWAWGANGSGQLGDGSNTAMNKPIKIMDNVVEVSAGMGHCLAIMDDGSLWSWGSNDYGQLGDMGKTNRNKPFRIMKDVKSIAAGENHSLAIKKDGSLWTWGSNMFGELGDGTNENKSIPIKIMDGVKAATAGYGYSIALKEDGSLWAWGLNGFGQLGDGTAVSKNLPVKVSEDSPEKLMDKVKQVSSGYAHSLAIKADGRLWGWGNNSNYQLGTGSKNGDKYTPIELSYFDVSSSIKPISLNKESMNINTGSYEYLISSATPVEIIEGDVIWESSNHLVAIVDRYGKVKGIGEGSADITITSIYNKQPATCTVNVSGAKDSPKSAYDDEKNEEMLEYAARKAVENYEAAPFFTDKDAGVSETLKKEAETAIKAVKNPVMAEVFRDRLKRHDEMKAAAKSNPPVFEQKDQQYATTLTKVITSSHVETYNDFYVVLSPAKQDLPTVVSGQSNYGTRSVYTDGNRIVTLEFRFTKDSEGKYYFEYKNGEYTYPFDFYSRCEFTPKQNGHIVLSVVGFASIDADDNVGANIVIFNSTDACVDVVTQNMRKDMPHRLKVDNRVGKVNLYW